MKQFNKTKIAAAVGTAALAMTLGAPANAAISLGGDNGWEVTYGGFINLFYTQSDWDDLGVDSAHLQEGLLPAFHTLTVKSPTINGLTGTGQITFAPDSSSAKTLRQDKGGSSIDMREVFFNVDGSFGTISAGRTLGLFQRQAILKDYTLFGVGAVAGPDGGGTTLGRIGFGYVYPAFVTRFTYKTPNINGFQLEVGVFDPLHPISPTFTTAETDIPQFQGEATYNTSFQGGTISAWAGGIWQETEVFNTFAPGGDDITSWGIDLGLDIWYGGFNIAGHWYTGEAIGVVFFNEFSGSGFGCTGGSCKEADNDGWYVQGGYKFGGKTLVGGGYGESNQDSDASFSIPSISNELWTVGVYHDVNSWLKLVAEYSSQKSTASGLVGGVLGIDEGDTFSVGGFLLW